MKKDLTPRQRSILARYMWREEFQEIGRRFGITSHAVSKTLDTCQQKLGLPNRIELYRYALIHRIYHIEQEERTA